MPATSKQFVPEDHIVRGYGWRRVLAPSLISTSTFIAYAGTLALGFVFDDHVLIVTNDSIRSWHYFPSYFTSHIWSFRYPHLLANYYRPFFLTWLRLNYALFGLHAWGWHLTSVLAHVAVTYLVYRLCLRLTGDSWVAAAAGLLFGLHPVHVEAVADITSIQEPLSTAFILAAVVAFFRSRESSSRLGWLAASLVLTAAALLSKESGMVLPILVGLYAWIYGDAGRGEVTENRTGVLKRLKYAVGASLPFWAVLLVYVPVRMWALKGFAHVVTALPLSQQVFTLPSVLLFYLRLLVWPVGLSCYYDTPYVSIPSWWEFAVPLLLLGGVAVGLISWFWRARRRMPREAKSIEFACLWILLTLFPVLNFRLLPDGEIAHDRYLYLPSVGFVILGALALRQLYGDMPRSFVRPVWALATALMLLMGYATARQTLFWSDDLTLNYRAHEIAPHNISATTSLAAAVAQQGMDGAAIELYRQALAMQPGFWRANVNLAYLYYAHGNYSEAAQYFGRATASDPTDGDQFLFLGMSLLRLGQLTAAEKAIDTALVVRPQGKNYHLGLGMVLKQEGRLREAQREISADLAADAHSAQAKALLEDVTRQMTVQEGRPSMDRTSKDLASGLK
jgi:Flp pilus assembly protein TadD/4-amino-4-deoxy-L-arabinose transferase-like glycosyltransferase